jgi:hypothetical protein
LAYGRSVSVKTRSGVSAATMRWPFRERSIAGLTENHSSAATALSMCFKGPLYQCGMAVTSAAASLLMVCCSAPREWTVKTF